VIETAFLWIGRYPVESDLVCTRIWDRQQQQ
jgi:hypothetical protein